MLGLSVTNNGCNAGIVAASSWCLTAPSAFRLLEATAAVKGLPHGKYRTLQDNSGAIVHRCTCASHVFGHVFGLLASQFTQCCDATTDPLLLAIVHPAKVHLAFDMSCSLTGSGNNNNLQAFQLIVDQVPTRCTPVLV